MRLRLSGALLALPLLGHMFDAKHYSEAFMLTAMAPVVGTMLWWWLTLPRRGLLGTDVTN